MNGKGRRRETAAPFSILFVSLSLLASSPGSFIDWIKVAFSREKGGARVKQFHCVCVCNGGRKKFIKANDVVSIYSAEFDVKLQLGYVCYVLTLRRLLSLSLLNRCWFVTLSTCHIATKASTPHCLSPLFSKSSHPIIQKKKIIIIINFFNFSYSCQKSPGDERQASASVAGIGADPTSGRTHPHHRLG